MAWETVIGLEVHVQLSTCSKIFSGASTNYGADPNTQACEVDIALPGVLPVMNRAAAHKAVKFGLAVDAEINRQSIFARKNYFYPDLPKGYQISQFELPIVIGGHMTIDTESGEKRIGITRAHLEEDAGKSLHEDFHGMTGIDLNRAGTPLLEVVSEPDMRSPAEAIAYLRKLHTLVRYLGICDGNMQEGSFRCDANVSVRPVGEAELGTRAELKNINSFRFIDKAIEFEVERQIDLIEDGGTVVQETRLYDPSKNETRPMRTKEEAHDYRYFPDPDLPPMQLDQQFIENARKELPELPDRKSQRFSKQYGLRPSDVQQLISDKATADYFEAVLERTQGDAKTVANWITSELAGYLNESNTEIEAAPIDAVMLAGLIDRIEDGTISGKIAKDVFRSMWNGEGTAGELIESKGLKQITDSGELESIVDDVLSRSQDQIEQYRGGQTKVFGYFVGQVMKATQGKANPQQVNTILKGKLEPDA
jgi:aspartyl-tRNA(Asn)/glutamyl-tRNA(Gln) amidotransferase subunit B